MKHTGAAEHNDRSNPSVVRFALQSDASLPPNVFRGMASVFGEMIETWCPTRIMPGAFSKTIQENTDPGGKLRADSRVRVLLQHGDPIGRPLTMVETAEGLLVTAEINAEMEDGKDALAALRPMPVSGLPVLDELSIGFDPVKWETVQEGAEEVRLIREVKLWEFSLVSWGANPSAKVMSVHALARSLPAETRTWLAPLVERMTAAEATDPFTFLRSDFLPVLEAHAGKVLSTKNKQLVQDALTALQALLDAAEPQADGQALTATVDRMQRDLALACLAARVAA